MRAALERRLPACVSALA